MTKGMETVSYITGLNGLFFELIYINEGNCGVWQTGYYSHKKKAVPVVDTAPTA